MLLLLLVSSILLSLPIVQTKIASYLTESLNKDFGISISIDKVAISPFGSIKLKGIKAVDDHQKELFSIQKLQTNILDFNKLVNQGHPYLGKAILEGLYLKIITYKGEKDSNLDKFIAAFDDGKPSSGKFRMAIDKITLTNSAFDFIDYNLETPKVLHFTKLNGNLSNFYIKGSSVTSSINTLKFKDHRGLNVKNLKANFEYTKKNITLQDLELKTTYSEIIGKIDLKYNRQDFADFNNKVIFDVTLEKAILSSKDLNYFYPEFGSNVFYIDTHLVGTLNNFTTYGLILKDANQSEIIGDVTFKHLFSKQKDQFSVSGNFDRITSNYLNLKKLMPNVLGKTLPSSLSLFGTFDVNGTIAVTDKNLDAAIIMISKLGKATSELYINQLQDIDKASYKGNVQLVDFDLGTLVSDKNLGKTTLDVNVDGKGFTKKYLDTKIVGFVDAIQFKGYDYQQISVDGKLKMPYYKGYINSNDPNLRMDFDGTVDLTSKTKNYNFEANIDYANLKEINLFTRDPVSILKGKIKIDASGNTVDAFKGHINIDDLYYQNHKSDFFFDNFIIESRFNEKEERTIILHSTDILSGQIEGKFKFNQLQKMVENAFGSLYANYVPNTIQKNQYFKFDLHVYDKVIEAVLPDLKVSKNTHLKGKIIADEELFKMDFSSPFIATNNMAFNGIAIEIDNKNPLYNTYITLDSLQTKQYKISDFNLINITEKDTLFFRTEFKGGAFAQDKFDLNLYHTITPDKNSVVGFKKSDLFFKNTFWYVNEEENFENKIVFDKYLKNFDFKDIRFSNGNETIDFSGFIKEDDEKELELKFTNVDLNKVTPDIENLVFKGNINGTIDYVQHGDVYSPISDIQIDSLNINAISLGDLKLQVSSDEYFRKFNINSTIIKDNFENFYTKGIIEFVEGKPILSLDTKVDKFNIVPLGPLLGDVFSNVRGLATGRASIVGTTDNPEIDGVVYLEEAGLTVPYLNVDYALEERSRLDITEEQFIFRKIKLLDTKYNTSGYLNGSIKHKALDNWILDVNITSERIVALDTQYNDQNYFGTAFLDGTATIIGPAESLEIAVEGQSSKGTSIKIPIQDTDEFNEVPYIKFIEKSAVKNQADEQIVMNGLQIDLDLNITTDADIEVILNKDTGHAMKGKGAGTMRMIYNTNDDVFSMNGDYMIYEGEYNYRLWGLITKKFNVKKFSNIVWTGDPMNADLNIQAVYNTQTNPSVLLESASITNRKVDTQVVIDITGKLSSPNIEFNLDYPTISSVFKSEIQYKLADKDTRQRQAQSVLAGGTYIVEGVGVSNYTSYALTETATSMISDMLSGENDKVKFGIDYSIGDRINEISDRVGVNLTSQINDKLSINGKVGVPVGGVNQSGIVGNVELQLQLNEDNSLRARAFNKENDITFAVGQSIGYTQGVGLTYTVDFDNFNELWKKIFSPKKITSNPINKTPYEEIPDSEELPSYITLNPQEKEKKKNSSDDEDEKAPEED